jgi:hypothetical protein
LLQYMDDLLLASCNQEKCWERTNALLAWLYEAGYKVSWKKAQVCQQEVQYLGFIISEGTVCPGSREEAGCLLHPSIKDQEGGLRISRSGRILSHTDTWILKPGQTTLWGQSRLWKRPSKLGTWPRKGFPGKKGC